MFLIRAETRFQVQKRYNRIAYIAMQKMYFDETIAFREMDVHIVMSQLLEIDTLLGIHIATA